MPVPPRGVTRCAASPARNTRSARKRAASWAANVDVPVRSMRGVRPGTPAPSRISRVNRSTVKSSCPSRSASYWTPYSQRSSRPAAAEETRRHILDAVYERLRAAPAQPVSVEQVARTARVARSTVDLIFGSRAGLFDAVAKDLMERGGFDRVVTAVAHPDAREHLRDGIRASCAYFAAYRDVHRVLFSTAALDPEATAG